MIVYQFSEFDSFLEAAKLAVKNKVLTDTHTPIHHEKLDELLRIKPRWVNAGYYTGGIVGLVTGALITIIPNVFTFRINVGGRPLFSWPAFAIVMFELMVLFAAIAAIGGFFYTQKYPRYDRAIFDLEEFQTKEKGEYFLVTTEELSGLTAASIHRLP